MVAAAIYLFFKTRGYIYTTSMMLGFLLLFYGPAYLLYMLYYNTHSVVYRQIIKSPYFDDGVVSLNLAIAIMYCGCVVGIEIVDKIASSRREELNLALRKWN